MEPATARAMPFSVESRPAGATARRMAAAVVLVVGMLAFGFVFHDALARVNPVFYAVRDDAVITLSHARNLVEYGFIGVSPSGERLEGFSAPLQFWVAAAAYLVAPFDFRTFCEWQTLAGTLLLGAAFALLLGVPLGPVEPGGAPARSRLVLRTAFVLAALPACALILSRSLTFLLWHASGMENAYRSVSVLLVLWCLDGMLRTGRWRWWAVPVVLAASLARIDAVVPVMAMVAVFALAWRARYRNAGGALFALVCLTPWLAYLGWRVWYFGQWQPNTALAQSISPWARLAGAVESPWAAVTGWREWAAQAAGRLHGFQLAGLALLPVLGWHRSAIERAGLLGAGLLGCLLQHAIFGAARLDPLRTTTEIALYATALVPFVVLAHPKLGLREAAIGLAVVGLAVAVVERRHEQVPEMGWGVEFFEANAARAEALARAQRLPRPTFANPDLGAVSWRKTLNVVDVGMLGSTLTPRVRDRASYLLHVAKPDIIELHDAWSCELRGLFADPVFMEDYEPDRAERTEWIRQKCPDAPAVASGIWVRRAVMQASTSDERRFLDLFARTLNPQAAAAEIERCLARPGPRPCDYVGRTLFRFVPELKRSRAYGVVADLLASDPRLAVERAYFTSSEDPAWWKVVLPHVP